MWLQLSVLQHLGSSVSSSIGFLLGFSFLWF